MLVIIVIADNEQTKLLEVIVLVLAGAREPHKQWQCNHGPVASDQVFSRSIKKSMYIVPVDIVLDSYHVRFIRIHKNSTQSQGDSNKLIIKIVLGHRPFDGHGS